MEKLTLDVQGMSCGHCVNAIETNVGKLDGVSTVAVNLETGKVDVDFDGAKTDKAAIVNEIEDQGYDVV